MKREWCLRNRTRGRTRNARPGESFDAEQGVVDRQDSRPSKQIWNQVNKTGDGVYLALCGRQADGGNR